MMDAFDTKITKMKQDIDDIKSEIETIQQKNKENKKSLAKSIHSLSTLSQRTSGSKKKNYNSFNNYNSYNNYKPPMKQKNSFNISNPVRPQKVKPKINMSTVTKKDPNEQLIEDICTSLNYTGPLDKLTSYIKTLRQKEELIEFVENNFKKKNFDDVNDAFTNLLEFISNYDSQEKEYVNEIEMYQNLCDELLKRNQDKINSEELNNYFNEIYNVKNMIEKYDI